MDADAVVLPMVVIEGMVLLPTDMGTVGVGVVMVVPSVRGGEVLVVLAMLVVVTMDVPCVDLVLVLGSPVMPVEVVIADGLRLVAVLCDVGA